MTVALAIPPLTLKNRPCALIRACALNQKNTVYIYIYTYIYIYQKIPQGMNKL